MRRARLLAVESARPAFRTGCRRISAGLLQTTVPVLAAQEAAEASAAVAVLQRELAIPAGEHDFLDATHRGNP